MKTKIKCLALAVAAVCILSFCAGCNSVKQGYTVEQDKYLFGMGELPADIVGGAVDNRVTMDMVADLAGTLNVKSFRIWMHITSVAERDEETDTVRLKPTAVEKYRLFIDKLKAAGITHFTAMSHYYLYPVGYSATAGSVIPDPDTEFEEYVRFLELLRQCYVLLAEAFPEVQYWEPSNETNGTDGRFIAKNGYSETTGADNSMYLYSQSDLAYITADLCWYANAGIKQSNPNAMTVLPGMIFNTNGNTAEFLQKVYDHIGSRYLPSGEQYADVESDNYFQVLNWHPYVGSWGMPDDNWINHNLRIYEVAEKNGDKGKKVFLTELGWQDQANAGRQETIAEAFTATVDVIKAQMPWVETFHTFRMFDWETCPLAPDSIERFFGLFTSPNNEQRGASPKPVALSLFRYFNGENADASGLYKYAKEGVV